MDVLERIWESKAYFVRKANPLEHLRGLRILAHVRMVLQKKVIIASEFGDIFEKKHLERYPTSTRANRVTRTFKNGFQVKCLEVTKVLSSLH